MSAAQKARLAGEVLVAYVRVRLLLARHDDAREILRILRDVKPLEGSRRSIAPDRLARAVTRTLAHLPSDTRCLAQSLTLTALLARRGHSGRVVIATRPSPFAAHAWVELDGRPLLAPHDFAGWRLAEL